jgi:nitrite reductase (NADH) large subunit
MSSGATPPKTSLRPRSDAPPPLRSALPPSRSSAPPGDGSLPPALKNAPVVVVGAGPVGIHVARELLFRAPELSVVLYGAEPWEPYNRVLLSELLAGEIDWSAIVNPAPLIESGRLQLRINNRIAAIDRIGHAVIDSVGNREYYRNLVLATGSSPYVPAFANVAMLGVYTYRDVNDAQVLMTNAMQSRCSVVLGGGVLGVEVARALKTQNTDTRVIVVHRGPHLMNRELDNDAAQLLEGQIRDAGIELVLRETISSVEGSGEIAGVNLAGGTRIECDTLVICTGIERNTRLAREAGLLVGQGIKVDDRMRTSDKRIYAVGECIEHRGEVYGLLAPGIEQAKVAANNITGSRTHYRGSDHYLRLKVVKVPVTSVWRGAHNGVQPRSITYSKNGTLRRLVVAGSHLVGATSVGAWDEIERVHQAVAERRWLWPWQLWRFRRKGHIWPARGLADVSAWPDTVMVCACMGVSCGMLRQAMAEGHTTVDALRERTGASQGCGACRPLLASLTGAPAEAALSGSKAGPGLAVAALMSAVLLLLLVVVPPIAVGRSVREPGWLDPWLLDPTLKQVSGYALAALAIASLLLPLRKRWSRFNIGSYGFWRGLHAALATAAAGVLVLHTGMRHGHGFNLALMELFLGVLLTGVLVGVLAWRGRGHEPSSRRLMTAHIILVWLLPALVAIHVLKVYYF